MKHFLRQAEYRPELDGIDPLVLLGIPLAILLLGLVVMRAVMAATVV